MLEGVGIDLIDVARMATILDKWGEKFLVKLFTRSEIAFCQDKANAAECFAARFAAKEALAKALGHGFCKHFRWTDVEVRRDNSGKPAFAISGVTQELVRNKRVLLSMTHIQSYAAAIATVEG